MSTEMDLLREYVRKLLTEDLAAKDLYRIDVEDYLKQFAPPKFGTQTLKGGAEADKKAWERAYEDLQKWEIENEKRIKATEAAEELAKIHGYKNIKTAINRVIQAQPELKFDSKILQKSADKLKKALEMAQKAWYRHDPERYHLLKSDIKDDPEGQEKKPDKEKPFKALITKIKPLEFYWWDDYQWNSVNNPKSPEYESLDFSDAKKGNEIKPHPGEKRLARIFGGERQGDSVSFDLVLPMDAKHRNFTRWEVKGIKSASESIRPGTEGRRVYEAPGKRLVSLGSIMTKFAENVRKALTDQDLNIEVSPQQDSYLKSIEKYANEEAEQARGGEIALDRFIKFRTALYAMKGFIDIWRASIGEFNVARIEKVLGPAPFGVKWKDMSQKDILQTIKTFSKHNPKILEALDSREMLMKPILGITAFKDPDAWLDAWVESLDVRDVFQKVSGIILVYPEGFRKVPAAMLKSHLIFSKISQNVPRYVFAPKGNNGQVVPPAWRTVGKQAKGQAAE